MKLDSKYFDRIRVKPDEDRRARETHPRCQWKGCVEAGRFPAPKGRGREGEYMHFCLDHVREYNRSYNYFKGMSDEAVRTYQEASVTGHRPTWTMGLRGREAGEPKIHGFGAEAFRDAFGLFGGEQVHDRPGQPCRTVRNAERKSLAVLNLDETASGPEIKARYKEMVKRHHPDANGGDRSLEDKLRDIINAYNYLKSVGFC